ncbi:MAG: BrnA antitoxin family protein [Synechococcus sp.]
MSEPFKKIVVQMPSLEEDELITRAAIDDQDALPLTDDQLQEMVTLQALRGRPRLANKKQLVSIRYSPEVLKFFKSYGAGWQSRMDAVLKEYVELHSDDDAKGA